MTPFTAHSGIGCAMPAANIDTDQIVPKQFLKTISRTGLKTTLFYDQRHDDEDRPIEGFVLDRAPFTHASILVAGDNFGCGSSREHAVWALLDFGFRCVISTTIADIFFNNAVNNGLLPAIVTPQVHERLLVIAAEGGEIMVDLEARRILVPGASFAFDVAPVVREKLLAGRDAIGDSLLHADAIDGIETSLAGAMPWLPNSSPVEVQNAV